MVDHLRLRCAPSTPLQRASTNLTHGCPRIRSPSPCARTGAGASGWAVDDALGGESPRDSPPTAKHFPVQAPLPHTVAMPSSSQWVAFLVASILFIQVPGPSLLFTIGRALTVGRREALLSVVGNAIGVTAQVALVAIGLGAVVAASITAYTVIKVAGAAYVIWLGIQAIRHRADARAALAAVDGAPVARTSALRSLRIGFTVGL